MTDKQLAILLRKYEQLLMSAIADVEEQLPSELKDGNPSGDGAPDPYPVVLDPIISVAFQLAEDAELLAPESED